MPDLDELLEALGDRADDQLQEDTSLVDELCAIERGLNDWELRFVESITRWVEDGSPLTGRQRTKGEEILARLSR